MGMVLVAPMMTAEDSRSWFSKPRCFWEGQDLGYSDTRAFSTTRLSLRTSSSLSTYWSGTEYICSSGGFAWPMYVLLFT